MAAGHAAALQFESAVKLWCRRLLNLAFNAWCVAHREALEKVDVMRKAIGKLRTY